MKQESKHISLELAQEIAEVAKEKGVKLPRSQHSWGQTMKGKWVMDDSRFPSNWGRHNYPAYDWKEILDFMGLDIPLDSVTELAIMDACKNNGKISKDTKATIRSLILEKLDAWLEK